MSREERLRHEPERRSTKAPQRPDQHNARLVNSAETFLRAERADARSVDNGCGCKLRASDAGRALRCAGGIPAIAEGSRDARRAYRN